MKATKTLPPLSPGLQLPAGWPFPASLAAQQHGCFANGRCALTSGPWPDAGGASSQHSLLVPARDPDMTVT